MKTRHFMRAFLQGCNKTGRLWLLFFLFLLQCAGPRIYIQQNADFTFIKKVAILSFENLTNDKYAGDKIRDIVTTEVLRRGYFDVVEHGEVNRVLKEEGMNSATAIGLETANRIGKKLGIQGLILGSVEEYGVNQAGGRSSSHVAVSMRLLAVSSGKILWHVSHNIEGGTVLDRLFGIGSKNVSEISGELVNEMIDTLF